jgi:hypothetical protein
MIRKWLAFLALATATAAPAVAAQTHCTQETLRVRGTPVTVGYCINGVVRADGADELLVPVLASYGAPGTSFSRQRELHFVAGESASRILESVDLTQLGMSGVLHLTLVYAVGTVRVEGALLTPGAITVK